MCKASLFTCFKISVIRDVRRQGSKKQEKLYNLKFSQFELEAFNFNGYIVRRE